ncbi:MAG: hypothetical protein GX193_02775 [Clostridiales bacterium]|nr:hypothetical protein [Clostridiales bacterium]
MGGAFKYARNKKGVTLVELILSIALVLIAAVLMFTFFSFMNRSNRLARQQSEIQENVVLAKTIIEGKIRKATYVTIGSTGGDPPSLPWSESIYLDVVDGKGVIYAETEGESGPLLAGLAEGYSMSLAFERVDGMFIRVSVGCISEDNYEYSVDTEIFLLGLASHQFAGDSGNKIYIETE